MNIKERYQGVIEYFLHHTPNPQTELDYQDTYQLLVAVILSAQCTDKRVNQVTPGLFSQYPNIQTLSIAQLEELFLLIKSISYPNNKAKHLIGMAKMVIQDFGGIIPLEVSQLTKLPGVGRKTANVITSVVDAQPNMAVDTHVFRVSARIGLTRNAKSPLSAEKQLVKYIPQQYISSAHHWLILHGRYICKAQNPQCLLCPLKQYCKYYEIINKQKQP